MKLPNYDKSFMYGAGVSGNPQSQSQDSYGGHQQDSNQGFQSNGPDDMQQ